MTEKTAKKTVNLATALSKAQGVMSGAKKGAKNPFFKSSYASLSSVFDAIRAPFAENGLSITQTMDVLESEKQILCTRLLHVSGEYIDSKMLLPVEANPQKLGSLISYYRRYSLMAICGIPAEDDDGNAASSMSAPTPKYINQKQISELEALINGNTRVRKLALDNCAQNMASITVDRFDGAVKWIKDELNKDGADHE